ncbi:LeuA family protein [Haladaptatus sp. YSMS36]|uniref:LeuA family protein n=1 Tax=Haladaptatus sp. YSMS36 TaxID=3033384 RepID=UPI0023E8BAE5|nr:LeuA family protein [Haladaptatus sp. YSMS36]
MQLNDVTLREGDQMPGRDFTASQKVECAHALDDVGVPFIQPAFPATGEKDQTVVRELSGTTSADIIALARALDRDIDLAIDAGADVVETFVSVSDSHLEHLLGKSRDEMETLLRDAVDHIIERGGTPHVTLADAFRTDPAYLVDIFELLPDVPILTLADSVGARTPHTVQQYFDTLGEDVDLARVGVHFHDDMGCGTANALTAYHAGVAKADVSIASLGERAGNSSFEEVAVSCAVDYQDDLGLDTTSLIPACRDILDRLGESYGRRKAVLGEEIAKHESGIHTAAMLADPSTLEPFDPATFGGERTLIFGNPTGEGGTTRLLERANVEPTAQAVSRFQDLLATHGPLSLAEALQLASREFGD